ncbi:MAG: hypothetical protein B9S32_09885 [Verrucomicrobia bacterium Tous-C9LFEB]|nr:MAG: hypothetical protein B9S32_09885 [Verrucomicrobia bacterium Tous-C9LFEB]
MKLLLLLVTVLVPHTAFCQTGEIANFDHWKIISLQGATAKRTVAPDGPSGKECLIIQIDKSGAGHLWFNQLKYATRMEKGKKYLLKFSMKADFDIAAPIYVSALLDVEPFTALAPPQKLKPHAEWQEFSYDFQPNAETPNARIAFQLNVAGAKFYIADITLTAIE